MMKIQEENNPETNLETNKRDSNTSSLAQKGLKNYGLPVNVIPELSEEYRGSNTNR